jgi:putative membrane protein
MHPGPGVERASRKDVAQLFIDYLAVMLINFGGGLALGAHYLYVKPDRQYRKSWAAGFFVVGLVGIVTSVPMVLTWPLPGGFNVAYGEPALLLSALFLAAAMTLVFEWEPLVPAIYGFFAAIYAVVIGIRLYDLKMGSEPLAALVGFVLTGVGGMLVLPTLQWHNNRTLTVITSVVLGLAALVWLYTGYAAGWGHILEFGKYLPAGMSK